jgi:two-component system chemotaxis response regulator CheY
MPGKKNSEIDWKDLQVLVVDDQKIARDLLRDMLREMGVSVILEAKDGDEALNLLSGAGGDMIDLIISDWNMPVMSGIELLKQLRTASVSQPFLLVTCRNDLQSIVEAKKFGVSAYILKPFSLTDLDSKISRVLAA